MTEVVYVKGNPYPYKMLCRPIKGLSGNFLNAVCLNKQHQYFVHISEEEIVKRKLVPVESI